MVSEPFGGFWTAKWMVQKFPRQEMQQFNQNFNVLKYFGTKNTHVHTKKEKKRKQQQQIYIYIYIYNACMTGYMILIDGLIGNGKWQRLQVEKQKKKIVLE